MEGMSGDTNAFLKRSKIDVLIPHATDFDPEELLECTDDAYSSVEERSLLYFVLRTLQQARDELRSYLGRLATSLDVLARGIQPRTSDSHNVSGESSPPQNEDILWSGKIDLSEKPKVLASPKNDGKPSDQIIVVWKANVPMSRPRMRLQSPVIVFRSSASLEPSEEERNNNVGNCYLPSGVPASVNVLESLKSDTAMHEGKPSLSAARLSRMQTPLNVLPTVAQKFKANERKAIPAVPAVSSRVRYASANDPSGKRSIIASLDIETAPFSSEDVKVTAVAMELSDGFSDTLGESSVSLLPRVCRPNDNAVFLFGLTPNETSSKGSRGSSQTSARTVLITVIATVLVSPSCQPDIQMQWKTSVDFSTALNPSFSAPRQSIQRPRRPSSLSRTRSSTNSSGLGTKVQGADSTVQDSRPNQRVAAMSDSGLSVTISGPRAAALGQTFRWNVVIVNGSSKPRQLGLAVVPRQKHRLAATHAAKPVGVGAGMAKISLDEISIYTMHRNTTTDSRQITSVNTEIRTG
ncbi:hypothetical protein ACLMJK_003980 [Lecanora helva]